MSLEFLILMVKKTTTIINRLGLHARPAALVVKLANSFPCDIVLSKTGQQANAKNIMEVLMLAATQGTQLEISAQGEKEDDALTALLALINNKFNEME